MICEIENDFRSKTCSVMFNKNRTCSLEYFCHFFQLSKKKMRGKWNFGEFEFKEVNVFMVQMKEEFKDENKESDKLRLLILSQSIAYFHIPAFFLDKTPNYFSSQPNNSCVVVFDIDDCFSTFKLPIYFQYFNWKWIPSDYFDQEIRLHFQRALILSSYYDYIRYNPIYLTTHLIITDYPLQTEPFILIHNPVMRNSSLIVKTQLLGDCELILDYPLQPKPNSYILIPPYEHSFKVLSSNSKTCVVKYVDLTEKTFEWKNQKYVLLKHPNVSIGKYFTQNPVAASTAHSSQTKATKSHCDFGTTDFLDISTDEIEDFFTKFFTEKKKSSSGSLSSLSSSSSMNSMNFRSLSKREHLTLDFPPPSPIDIANDIIEDKQERQIILRTLKVLDDVFPSKYIDMTLLVANFLSSFRFDFGFNLIFPPKGTTDFAQFSEFNYEHLGIPDILVIQNDHLTSAPATQIISQWESSLFRPISGPKDLTYVVFYNDTFQEQEIITFFKQFCYNYNLCSFGTLTRYSKDQSYFPSKPEKIPQMVMNFFEKNHITQYQHEQLITFIVGDPIFSSDFTPHSVISYVRPDAIREADQLSIKTLAFVVYSRVRVFAPRPFGMVYLAPQSIAACFFGFGYQPPFLLKQRTNDFIIHICWDVKSKLSTWCDDTGAVMHVLPVNSITTLFGFISELVDLFQQITVKTTLTLLDEGITPELLSDINNNISTAKCEITLFSMFTSASTQCVFTESFLDDVVVFDKPEFSFQNETKYENPVLTCFVCSQNLQPYTCSLYTQTFDPKSVLMDYVQRMSHLSWLSIKPGMENRTISYPPHMMALLRKANGPVAQLSMLEYLSSTERI